MKYATKGKAKLMTVFEGTVEEEKKKREETFNISFTKLFDIFVYFNQHNTC